MAYLKRTADVVLKERLEAFGAVLIEGPKWCGKTTTAEQARSGYEKRVSCHCCGKAIAAA